MNKCRSYWFSLLALFVYFSCEQKQDTIAEIHYPSNVLASDSAELFAPGVISTDSFEHSAPSFSSDGKFVMWTTIKMPAWHAVIWEMKYEDGKWSTPDQPSFSDSTANDIYPSFSPDGNIIYFSSNRTLPSGRRPADGNILWYVKNSGKGWSAALPLDTAISNGHEFASSVSADGTLYFTYGPFGTLDWNIMEATNINNPRASVPKMLDQINTGGYEDGPFIAKDESYLIFESDRPGSVAGSIDLYISFKSEKGVWRKPLNMGPKINTAASERFARVSPDGKFLFFGSSRRLVHDQPNFDIYWINAAIIDSLRSEDQEYSSTQ